MNTNIIRIIKSKRCEYIIISIIIILGFIVRLYKINTPLADWHSFRQADTASVTKIFITDGINLLHPKYQDISRVQSGIFNPQGYRFVEFPIYNLFHAILAETFPQFSLEVWGRLLTIFLFLISTYTVFLIGRKLMNKWAGLLSAFLFAFLPFNIFFTRVILPEPMVVTMGLLSIWFYMVFTKKENNFYFYLSAAFMSLGFLIKPYVFLYGFPILFITIRKYGIKEMFRQTRLYIFALISLVPFILWRIWMSQYPAGIPFWKWTLNGDGIRFRPAFWRWIFGERIGRLILGIWGLLPFGIGLLTLKKKDIEIIAFGLGAIVYMSLFATANVRHDYYQILIIPLVALILGKGIIEIWNNSNWDLYIRRSLLIFSLILMFGISAYQVKDYYLIIHPEIIEAGQAVDSLTPKDAIVIAPYNGDTAFLYQTKRQGWPVVELPIEELIAEGAQYYVSVNFDPQTQEFMQKFRTIRKTDKYVILDLTQKI
jgi:hypothetical protein